MLQEPETYMSGLTDAEKVVIAYLEINADLRCDCKLTESSGRAYHTAIAIMQQIPTRRLNEIIREYAR